jgi:hypothetical protein
MLGDGVGEVELRDVIQYFWGDITLHSPARPVEGRAPSEVSDFDDMETSRRDAAGARLVSDPAAALTM